MFSAMPRGMIFAIGLVAVLLVSAVDFVTGPLLSLAILYLIPIDSGAWFLGVSSHRIVQ